MHKILAASLLGTAVILSGAKANAAIIGGVEGTLSLKKTVPNMVFIPKGQDQVSVLVGASSTLTTMFTTDEGGVSGTKAISFGFEGGEIDNPSISEPVTIAGAGSQTETLNYAFSQNFLLSAGTYSISVAGGFFGGEVFLDSKATSFTVAATPAEVPEPLTLLGSATALGFGALLKREHSKKQEKPKA